MTTPDFMPVLSAGAHRSPKDGACIMELCSYLAGEAWSDSPACTHPALASAARVTNDRMPAEHRHLLIPLIGRLFGSSEPVDVKALSEWMMARGLRQARAIEHESKSGAAKRINDAVEDHHAGKITLAQMQQIRNDANAYAYAYADANAYAYAYAYAYANAYADAYAARRLQLAERMVEFLSELIDEYDRLSGRTAHREVTTDDLRTLADLVA